MTDKLEQIKVLIDKHLIAVSKESKSKWKIDESSVHGKGIFASEDIQPGETIFIDHPVILGPQAKTKAELHCVICTNTFEKVPQLCPKNCHLPLCNNCVDSPLHLNECDFILNHLHSNQNGANISEDLFRSLSVLRVLFVPEEHLALIKVLISHNDNKKHGFEIALLKKYLRLSEMEETKLKFFCSILDSNTFETPVKTSNNQTIMLRGIYPLAAIMNHNCVPNTTHVFDKDQNMIVKATMKITKDQEIFVTYSSLLWNTQSRRIHLASTKHFWCHCDRCKDPTEFGTNLNALKCTGKNCPGQILPIEPLKINTPWKCSSCGSLISCQKIGIIQSTLGSMLGTLNSQNLQDLLELITERVNLVVPSTNHICLELKLKVLGLLSHTESSHKHNELPLYQLILKEKFCQDILLVLEQLGLGLCKLRGQVLYELYRTQIEIYLRRQSADSKAVEIPKDNRAILTEAISILDKDITAPKDIYCFAASN